MPRFEKLNPNKEGYGEADIASKQAVYQLLALVVTILIALVGGAVTGMIMRMIAQFERLDEHHRPNQTILKLALSVGNLTGKALGVRGNIMPEEAYFDDHLFFEVHEDEKMQKVIIKDHKGKKRNYDHRKDSVSFHEMHRDNLSMDMMGGSQRSRTNSEGSGRFDGWTLGCTYHRWFGWNSFCCWVRIYLSMVVQETAYSRYLWSPQFAWNARHFWFFDQLYCGGFCISC
jgi:hypothetical protein